MYFFDYRKHLSIIILGTWLPELQRWCIAYRPDDLMMVNTNNGTERLNEDLKYDELMEYKNCTLSDLLAVIVERFIPKLYEKYIELNIKFTSAYRKYDVNIPHYMHNRPRWIVDDMLEKVGKISNENVSVSIKDENSFFVKSLSPWTTNDEYEVRFGSPDTFCSCSCPSFRKNRVLCKHFFAIIEKGLKIFEDVSILYRSHPFIVLDEHLFNGSSLHPTMEMFNDPHPSNNDTEEEIDTVIEDESDQPLANLPIRGSQFKLTKMKLLSKIKVLTEKVYCVKRGTESEALLNYADETISSLMLEFDSNLDESSNEMVERNDDDSRKRKINCPEPVEKKKSKKHPFSGRVGATADMMKQYYRARLTLQDMENAGQKISCSNKKSIARPSTREVAVVSEVEVSTTEVSNDVLVTADIPGEGVRKFVTQEKLNDHMIDQITKSRLQHDVINLAANILRKQKHMSGFEDTGLLWHQLSCMAGDFIQILHINSPEHWIVTFRTKDSKTDEISVCDSLFNKNVDYPDDTIRALCRLASCQQATLRINWLSVQQQSNAVDCGVYAIAYAVICLGIDCDTSYDQLVMRDHLLICLHLENSLPFQLLWISRCKSTSSTCLCFVYVVKTIFTDADQEDLFMAMCRFLRMVPQEVHVHPQQSF